MIGFGTCQLHLTPEKRAIETLLRGFDLGVNIVHTSPSYGNAEDVVARAVRRSGHKVIVATTGYDVPGNEGGPVSHFGRLFEATSERLGTERLDLYGIEHIDGREAQHENVWGKDGMVEFLSRKKAQGRLRGIFCTTHGAPEYVRRLVTSGAFDAVMLAYNILGYHLLSYNPHYRLPPPPGSHLESLPRNRQEIFPLCREHDVGLMIMKPLGGGLLCESKALPPRHRGTSALQNTRASDILRSILLNPEVSCVLPGTASVAEAEENASSGYAPTGLGADQQEKLKDVVEDLKKTVCSRCGACDALCSRGLPISWIFWAGLLNLYPSAVFEQPENIDYFHLHPQLQATCATCSDMTCVCPDDIDIPQSLKKIHSQMMDLMRRGLIPPPDTEKGRIYGDGTFGARIASADIPRTMEPGEGYLCRIHLENAGERGWLADANLCADRDKARVALGVFIDEERIRTIEVTRDVHQGDRWHSSFEIAAPLNVDRFRLSLRLLGEHQQFSMILGPVVFSEDIHVGSASSVKGEHITGDELECGGIQLRLDEVEAERNKLRADVEAQREQILVTADRLGTLEQLFQTIQAGRAYKVLRRLGRWKWVEQTLAHLPNAGEATAQPSARDVTVPSPIEPLKDWNLNPYLHPLEGMRGYAGHLIDRAGHDFIDFSAAWGANILGYGYPRVTEAIIAQARRFAGIGMPCPECRELEQLLYSVIPGADMVRYGKNGSDATMGAVRLARALTGRERVLHRGYHGFH